MSNQKPKVSVELLPTNPYVKFLPKNQLTITSEPIKNTSEPTTEYVEEIPSIPLRQEESVAHVENSNKIISFEEILRDIIETSTNHMISKLKQSVDSLPQLNQITQADNINIVHSSQQPDYYSNNTPGFNYDLLNNVQKKIYQTPNDSSLATENELYYSTDIQKDQIVSLPEIQVQANGTETLTPQDLALICIPTEENNSNKIETENNMETSAIFEPYGSMYFQQFPLQEIQNKTDLLNQKISVGFSAPNNSHNNFAQPTANNSKPVSQDEYFNLSSSSDKRGHKRNYNGYVNLVYPMYSEVPNQGDLIFTIEPEPSDVLFVTEDSILLGEPQWLLEKTFITPDMITPKKPHQTRSTIEQINNLINFSDFDTSDIVIPTIEITGPLHKKRKQSLQNIEKENENISFEEVFVFEDTKTNKEEENISLETTENTLTAEKKIENIQNGINLKEKVIKNNEKDIQKTDLKKSKIKHSLLEKEKSVLKNVEKSSTTEKRKSSIIDKKNYKKKFRCDSCEKTYEAFSSLKRHKRNCSSNNEIKKVISNHSEENLKRIPKLRNSKTHTEENSFDKKRITRSSTSHKK